MSHHSITCVVFFIVKATSYIYTYCHTLSLHYALPISAPRAVSVAVESLPRTVPSAPRAVWPTKSVPTAWASRLPLPEAEPEPVALPPTVRPSRSALPFAEPLPFASALPLPLTRPGRRTTWASPRPAPVISPALQRVPPIGPVAWPSVAWGTGWSYRAEL